ncbi:MAG: class I SAM-dependent methyltransferase [Hyphomicrobiales bacterium]|nr:class I SAM-dependent methyltransferase [Hyphomicrobiales bacterium]
MTPFDIAAHLLPFTRYRYDGETVPCPVCGFASHTPVAGLDRRLKRLSTVMCDRCGLLRTNPMPSEEALDRYYERYYRLDYQGAVSAPRARHLRKRAAEASERRAWLRPRIPAGGRTLDFGAGSGEFVSAMLEAGFDAQGFEPGAAYASHARQTLGRRMVEAGWRDVKHQAEFDLVTCMSVLEHLGTPVEALQAMVSWLKPGGKVFVMVPDMQHHAQKGFGALHFAHVVGFNHHNLQYAAGRVGLRMIDMVNPTRLLFGRGPAPDMAELAQLGLATARASYIDQNPVRAYFAYQLGRARRPLKRSA